MQRFFLLLISMSVFALSCSPECDVQPLVDTELIGGWHKLVPQEQHVPASAYYYFEKGTLYRVPAWDFNPLLRTHNIKYEGFEANYIDLISPYGNHNLIAQYTYSILPHHKGNDTLVLTKLYTAGVNGDVGYLPDTLIQIE